MRLPLLIALVAATGRAVSAQTPSIDPRLAAAVRALPAGTPTRISGPAGARLEGRFVSASADSLVLRDVTSARVVSRVALAGVDTLWRGTRGTAHGATAGAIVGGIGLAAFGVFIVSGFCENADGCRGDYPAAALGGFTVGAVSGALVGGSVGHFIRGWRRVYP